ncbi:hypothetical protein TorRG33x02_037820, partial [Trema orientale]
KAEFRARKVIQSLLRLLLLLLLLLRKEEEKKKKKKGQYEKLSNTQINEVAKIPRLSEDNLSSFGEHINHLVVTRVTDFHVCPHDQLAGLGIPLIDHKPHSRRQIQPENQCVIGRIKKSTNLSPVNFLS